MACYLAFTLCILELLFWKVKTEEDLQAELTMKQEHIFWVNVNVTGTESDTSDSERQVVGHHGSSSGSCSPDQCISKRA